MRPEPPASKLQPPTSARTRYSEVSTVLVRVLFLNIAVAAAKIAFGYASGAISILSDGFHSLTDAASNVVGLVGIHAAGQPPDEDHPYGHRKYETVAAAALTVFLLLLFVEVLRNAFNHLSGRIAPHSHRRRKLRGDAGHRGREPVRGRATNPARQSGSAAKC